MAFNQKEYAKAWRLAKRAEIRKYNKMWRSAHPEYAKEWYLANRAEAVERAKVWQLAHLEQIKKYNKEWNLANHAERTAQKKAWRFANIERIKEWRKTPKGKEALRKGRAKRKQFGFVPLNKFFAGAEGHHINKKQVIYMPEKIHRSIPHSVSRNRNMDEINAKAFEFLQSQF